MVCIDSCPLVKIFVLASQFYVYLPCLGACLAQYLKCESPSRRLQSGESCTRAFSVMIVKYPPRNLRLNLYNTNRVYHRLHLRLNNDINIRYFLSFNQQPTAHRWLAHIFVCEDIFIFFLCENVNVHSISTTGLRF